MRCCRNCFSDNVLKEQVEKHGRVGDCSFCGTSSVTVIAPRRLGKFFAPAIKRCETLKRARAQIYEDSYEDDIIQSAKDLPSLLEETFYARIFSRRLSKAKKSALLDTIRGTKSDGRRSGQKWVRNNDWLYATELGVRYDDWGADDYWFVFERAIKTERRFFFKGNSDPIPWLKQIIPKLEISISPGQKYWRARLGTQDAHLRRPFPFEEMGPPLHKLIKAGRMNPNGIPVLYLSNSFETAINEIRPYLGAYVSVACFEVNSSLRVVDLTSKLDALSPFQGDDIDRAWMQRNFLRVFNQRLAEPISPSDSARDYLPTQYISEFIKHLGFDGVVYQSVFSRKDRNIAIFDSVGWRNKFRLGESSRLMRVDGLSLRLSDRAIDKQGYEEAIQKEEESRATAYDLDDVPF